MLTKGKDVPVLIKEHTTHMRK